MYLSSAQQEGCGSIGKSDETALTPLRAQFFYLDTASPAPCTGNITNWRVCYYGPESIDDSGSYWATYAVYRRMGTGDNVHYERVSGVFRAIRGVARFTEDPIVDGEITKGGFNCFKDFAEDIDLPINIEAGDIVGACVFDPIDSRFPVITRFPLDVVGDANGELTSTPLLQMSTAGCSLRYLPSTISANQLSILNFTRLHIHANISTLLQ